MSRRRPRLGTVALAVSLALAGCTDPGSPGADRPSPQSTRPVPSGPMPTASPGGRHVLGLKWNWSQRATLDYAAATAGGATFAEVEWCAVEPAPGERDWTRTDEIVRRSEQLGHEVMLKIRTGRCWATRPPDPGVPDRTEAVAKTPSTFPADEEAYRAFVLELVTRYAAMGVHTYAVENEPDVYNFWAGTIGEYEELVRLAAPAIREADPVARVLEAGLSSTAYGVVLAQQLVGDGEDQAALAAYQDYYRRRIEGGASRWPQVTDPADLTSVLSSASATRAAEVLAASARLVTEGVVDAYQLHFYEPSSELPAVLALVRGQVGEAAVEAWELGVAWPGDGYDAGVAAAETTRLIGLLLADGVTRVVYLPLAYTPGSTPQVFRGLVEDSGEVLPAGEVYRLLTGLLAGRDAGQLLPVDPGTGLTGVVIDRGDQGQAAVVWADAGEELELEAGETVTDHLGEPVPTPVEVGADPVIVTSPDASLARLTSP